MIIPRSLKNIFFIYLFLERGREGETEGENHQCVVASSAPPTGDLAGNPDMCPDWESNQQCFGSQVSTQSTESHQPGPYMFSFLRNCQTISHSGCAILHSYQECTRVSVPPNPHTYYFCFLNLFLYFYSHPSRYEVRSHGSFEGCYLSKRIVE